MKYVREEKTKMDILMQTFRSYVNQREDYDVLYSEKAGYLRVLTGESCDAIYFPIAGFADMLRMFVEDFLSDEEERVGNPLKQDYDHVRSLLMPRLDTLGAYREEACRIMEETFEAWRARCARFRRNNLAEIQRLEELLASLRASIA